MGTGTTALFQLSVGIFVNTAKTLRVFPAAFCWVSAYFAFRSLLQFEKTLQEPGRCKQAESPARKTPDENRRQVRRLKGKLGRGVRGLRLKRLGRVVARACSFTRSPLSSRARLFVYALALVWRGCVRRDLVELHARARRLRSLPCARFQPPSPMRVQKKAPNLPENRQFSSN